MQRTIVRCVRPSSSRSARSSCDRFDRSSVGAPCFAGIAALAAAIACVAPPAVATLTVAAPAKVSGPGQSNSTGVVTISIPVTLTQPLPDNGICPPALPPVGAPSFSMDFYEKDWPDANDCSGLDATQAGTAAVPGGPPAIVVTPTAWAITAGPNQVANTCFVTYTYTYTVSSFCHGPPATCEDSPASCGDSVTGNDPFVWIRVNRGTVVAPGGGWAITGGLAALAGSCDIAVPGLPQVGLADIGVEGPSQHANSSILDGLQIAAFSRGHDEISLLFTPTTDPSGHASLYIAADPETQDVPMELESESSLVFVVDGLGQVWNEQAFGGVTPKGSGLSLHPLRYLNVNTAASNAVNSDGHLFFVTKGTSQVLHASEAKVSDVTLFLDLDTTTPVTALALEDRGERGRWDAGDLILYSVQGSSAIHLLAFGGTPQFLSANGITFDGNSMLSYEGLSDNLSVPAPSFHLGHVTALSVASGRGNQVSPGDRASRDLREFDADAFDPAWMACPADLTGDGKVGGDDLAILLNAIDSMTLETDLDGSAFTDAHDLGVLLANWGGCG